MAMTDYVVSPLFNSFADIATLSASISPGDTTVYIKQFRPFSKLIPQPGDAVMIDNEVMKVVTFNASVLELARGCVDTVPAVHVVGRPVWFLKGGVGSDRKTYAEDEDVGVKPLPRTASKPPLPLQTAPAVGLTFVNRLARPYPPGKVIVNELPFWSPDIGMDSTDDLVFTWTHRDRITQDDQLVAHGEDSVGPETGVTYILRVFDAADPLTTKATYPVDGDTWTYTLAMAVTDLEATAPLDAYITLHSVRDTLESFQHYRVDFHVTP